MGRLLERLRVCFLLVTCFVNSYANYTCTPIHVFEIYVFSPMNQFAHVHVFIKMDQNTLEFYYFENV